MTLVYLPTFTIKINKNHVGKYTNHPMDPMGMAMGPWRLHPGWDATSLVAPPDADPDYYEDKKILDSRSGGFGGGSKFGWPKKRSCFSYINWKVGALPVLK